MIFEADIQFTSNFLGGLKKDNRGVRSMIRTPSGLIYLEEEEWRAWFKKAATYLKIDIDTGSIILPEGFESNSTSLLRRVFNKVKVDLFEGIERGNSITIQFLIEESSDKHPSLDDMEKMLDVIGKFYGISQFGKKFHCGRFKLQSLTLKDKENYEVKRHYK
jgi:hypothetical protein